jgi:hypothetical protein
MLGLRARRPRQFIEVEISGIGVLRNYVIAEK